MKVRLTRKLAECINGIDLSRRRVGDVFDLAPREARMIIAEGWAVPARSLRVHPEPPHQAADARRSGRKARP